MTRDIFEGFRKLQRQAAQDANATLAASDYMECVAKLRAFESVFITGPQRSGTTIAATMIAHDLGRRFIDGNRFNVDRFERMLPFLKPDAVIQAPGLCASCHLLPATIAVVFLFRDIAEIVRSQDRVVFMSGKTWTHGAERFELSKYFRTDGVISEVKYDVWERFQKPLMRRDGKAFFELPYRSLEGHPLWMPDEERKHFGPRQTALAPSKEHPPAVVESGLF